MKASWPGLSWLVERLFFTAIYMEYSRMRPEGEEGASHVMWTESFAWEQKKKKDEEVVFLSIIYGFLKEFETEIQFNFVPACHFNQSKTGLKN